ncbi:MAG: hypothetical protein KAW88_10075 [Candidatus Cloacimonetes bacterium]|nr:hypothetical protein [Candidatus Cloacimonadota bacterium]
MKKQNKNEKLKKQKLDYDPYLMRINKGERMYKIYIFRPFAGRENNFEYRILTKEKTNGMLEMVSYNFKIVDGVPQKSSIMKSPEVPKDNMDEMVQNMMITTNTSQEEFEEIDLSDFKTLEEQIEFLQKKNKVDSMYVT